MPEPDHHPGSPNHRGNRRGSVRAQSLGLLAVINGLAHDEMAAGSFTLMDGYRQPPVDGGPVL